LPSPEAAAASAPRPRDSRRGCDVVILFVSQETAAAARAILWLLSEEASFTTGAFLDVTGGL